MKAVRFEGPGKVSLAELPDPQPAAGWVRIQIKAAALCMTDFELLRGTHHEVEYPLTPGHEYCGVVDKVGSAAADINKRLSLPTIRKRMPASR